MSDSRWFAADTNEPLHEVLHEGVLIVAYASADGKGPAAGWLAPASENRWAERTIERFRSLLDTRGKLAFKIVGVGEAAHGWEREFRQSGETVLATRIAEDALEIWFQPSTGKLRVATRMSLEHRKRRVLVIDDSRTVRTLLAKVISDDPGFELAGMAADPSEALSLIATNHPDLITLDLHLPGMDGVELLRSYLPRHPIPTVIVTAVSMEESDLVLSAMEAGAVDYFQKPQGSSIDTAAKVILEKLHVASRARVQTRPPSAAASRPIPALPTSGLIALGGSTGGTEAIKSILCRLPSKTPPIVISQHIPDAFSASFAERLDRVCEIEVREARDGDLLLPSLALLAPGGKQLRVVLECGVLSVRVEEGDPENRHRPSVDILFRSIARARVQRVVACILTGMGGDGAEGLLELREAGATTFAQDADSSVVFGMPRQAISLGAAQTVAPLDELPHRLADAIRELNAASPKGTSAA